MILRELARKIENRFYKGKALIVFGARQTGKSTLIEYLLKDKPHLYLNGDDADTLELLTNTTVEKLRLLTGSHNIVFIEEAQRIRNIGLTLKLFTDHIKQVQVITTGSSAFELSGKVNEPLTGRKYEFTLYPLSFGEMVQQHGFVKEKRLLEHRLIFGYYPEIVTKPNEAEELLKLLANSYLYKDLLMLEQIRKPLLLSKLLKALALQIGSEVKMQELAQIVESDPQTVDKYIDLLEKAYVIFRLPALNLNVRNELKKAKKVFFYDCGIRNAVINNFKPLGERTDTGALWENFMIAERIKYLNNKGIDAQHYFWRTTQQQEIDFIEERDGKLLAVEFKWSPKSKAKFSTTFTGSYPNSRCLTINPDNLEDFLLTI